MFGLSFELLIAGDGPIYQRIINFDYLYNIFPKKNNFAFHLCMECNTYEMFSLDEFFWGIRCQNHMYCQRNSTSENNIMMYRLNEEVPNDCPYRMEHLVLAQKNQKEVEYFTFEKYVEKMNAKRDKKTQTEATRKYEPHEQLELEFMDSLKKRKA